MRRSCVGMAAALFGAAVLSACNGGSAPATERDFSPKKFSRASVRIDNAWFPLRPGTQFVYDGRVEQAGGGYSHRVVTTVTDLTKVVDGVRTVVILDRDLNGDRIDEQEITFQAQDDDGNVWNLGEYPEEYENGKLTGAPSTWISGLGRARAGILMRTAPKVGQSTYLQGSDPEVEFRDRAKVERLGQRRCVPHKCYSRLLTIDESSPLDPSDGHQLKYYARGIGNVLVEPRGGVEQETLVLVEVKHLSAAELAEARSIALELDKRAYTVAADVYRSTPHAERTLRTAGAA
jgi:hypothetical protein